MNKTLLLLIVFNVFAADPEPVDTKCTITAKVDKKEKAQKKRLLEGSEEQVPPLAQDDQSEEAQTPQESEENGKADYKVTLDCVDTQKTPKTIKKEFVCKDVEQFTLYKAKKEKKDKPIVLDEGEGRLLAGAPKSKYADNKDLEKVNDYQLQDDFKEVVEWKDYQLRSVAQGEGCEFLVESGLILSIVALISIF